MTGSVRVGRHEVPATPWISQQVAVGPSPGRGAGLFATEPLAAGEIVVVWGGESYADAEGAARARAEGRGTITGADWRLEVLRERYAGHFIPHVNRRIADAA